MNPECCDCWEVDSSVFINQNWISFLDQKCSVKKAQEVMEFVNTKKQPVLCTRWFKPPDKEPSLVRSLLTPVMDENEEVTKIIVWNELIKDRRTPPSK